MAEAAPKSSAYERLLRLLLRPIYRTLGDQQARQDRQRDELDAIRGHAEQARRQLREAITSLEAEMATGRDAFARTEALAAALHSAHLRLDELQNHIVAVEGDGERRSQLVAAALEALRDEQVEALALVRTANESRAARQEQELVEAAAAAEQALAGVQAELNGQLQQVRTEQQSGQVALEALRNEQAEALALARTANEAHAARQEQELAAVVAASEQALAGSQAALNGQLQHVRAEQQSGQAMLNAELTRLNAELPHRIAKLAARLQAIEAPAEGLDYAAFEARFRGSETLIRERQKIYIPQLQNHAPIADLGCGRGELVAMLREAGLDATGVESNPGQLAACHAQAIRVEGADLFDWLEARPAASLGAITCLQVIEHMTLSAQRRFLELARRALRPDGMLLIETVNPHCAEAMEWFYIDPTHQRPVYPEMLEFLMQQAGFGRMTVRFQIPCTGAPAGEPLNAATGADFALWGFNS